MKKPLKIIISLLSPLVLPINFLYAEDVVPEKIELLPEVKALVAKQEILPDDFFENNLFIGLSGVFYPEDNFYEVASEIFQHNYPEYLKAVVDPRLTVKDLVLMKLEDKLPEGKELLDWTDESRNLHHLELCSKYLAKNCIANTEEAREKFERLIEDNRELLYRYKSLALNRKKHKDHVLIMASADYSNSWRGYQGFNPFLLLSLNQSVLEIKNGNIQAGIENIYVARSLLFSLLNSEKYNSLMVRMLAFAYLPYLDQFMDALLTEGYLNNYLIDERIIKIVAPYPESFELGIRHSLVFSQDYGIYRAIKDHDLNNDKINELYQIRTRYLDALDNNILDKERSEIDERCDAFNAYTQAERMLGYCVLPNEGYLNRYFTQRNYHNMVYLKYLIMRDKIADKEIPTFLIRQGEIAIDPITNEPFQWNSENRTISLPLPEMKLLPASIQRAVQENPEIKYLQVTIPQPKDGHLNIGPL